MRNKDIYREKTLYKWPKERVCCESGGDKTREWYQGNRVEGMLAGEQLELGVLARLSGLYVVCGFIMAHQKDARTWACWSHVNGVARPGAAQMRPALREPEHDTVALVQPERVMALAYG